MNADDLYRVLRGCDVPDAGHPNAAFVVTAEMLPLAAAAPVLRAWQDARALWSFVLGTGRPFDVPVVPCAGCGGLAWARPKADGLDCPLRVVTACPRCPGASVPPEVCPVPAVVDVRSPHSLTSHECVPFAGPVCGMLYAAILARVDVPWLLVAEDAAPEDEAMNALMLALSPDASDLIAALDGHEASTHGTSYTRADDTYGASDVLKWDVVVAESGSGHEVWSMTVDRSAYALACACLDWSALMLGALGVPRIFWRRALVDAVRGEARVMVRSFLAHVHGTTQEPVHPHVVAMLNRDRGPPARWIERATMSPGVACAALSALSLDAASGLMAGDASSALGPAFANAWDAMRAAAWVLTTPTMTDDSALGWSPERLGEVAVLRRVLVSSAAGPALLDWPRMRGG
jgi:hypothetical protein